MCLNTSYTVKIEAKWLLIRMSYDVLPVLLKVLMDALNVSKSMRVFDYSRILWAICPDFESPHSREWEPHIPVI
jgi:hypothetical protein